MCRAEEYELDLGDCGATEGFQRTCDSQITAKQEDGLQGVWAGSRKLLEALHNLGEKPSHTEAVLMGRGDGQRAGNERGRGQKLQDLTY